MKPTRVFPAVLAAGVVAAAPVHSSDWNYQLTPYLWASGLNGTQRIGNQEVELDAEFSDLVEFLDIGFAARLEARNATWGWYADYFYSKLSDEKNLPRTALEGEVKQTIAEGGISYRFNEQLEGMAGLLYQKSELGINLGGAGLFDGSESWVDGLIGLRWTPVDTEKWNVWLRGNVGAGDSDLVWLATAGIGYRFNQRWSVVAAYRYLDTDYESDDFAWDITQDGLGIGVGISW